MKKKLCVILSVVLAMGLLAGCGKNASENAEFLKDVDVSKYLTLDKDYKGLLIEGVPDVQEVTEEQTIELALAAYNASVTADYGVTGRAVEMGDTVNIDYEGKKDDVAFAGGTAQNQSLGIGSGQFIPGFEEKLVGVMTGETVDLDLTFPEAYKNPDLAGQAVVFTVTVNYIYPSAREEMQDSLIAEMTQGEYTTVDAFIDYCREYIALRMEEDYTTEKENAVIKALEETATFKKLPEGLVNKYTERVTEAINAQAAKMGVDAETFCGYYFQKDAATYAKEAAEASVRQGLIFKYIADKENLNVSDEELDKELQTFADENGYASVEELLDGAEKEDFREYYMFKNVVNFVYENGVFTEAE